MRADSQTHLGQNAIDNYNNACTAHNVYVRKPTDIANNLTTAAHRRYRETLFRICMNNKQRSCIIKIALSSNPFLELARRPRKVFTAPGRVKAFVNRAEWKRFRAMPLGPDDTTTKNPSRWGQRQFRYSYVAHVRPENVSVAF